jgi:hypothetical protein
MVCLCRLRTFAETVFGYVLCLTSQSEGLDLAMLENAYSTVFGKLGSARSGEIIVHPGSARSARPRPMRYLHGAGSRVNGLALWAMPGKVRRDYKV